MLSCGAVLDTNGNTLFVVGQTTITGARSSILVNPTAGDSVAFNTNDSDINTSSALQMSGGTLDVDILLRRREGSKCVSNSTFQPASCFDFPMNGTALV